MERKETRFFAAANSSRGFVNFFPQVFDSASCSRLYIIKGGPGTGKSRFMRETARFAAARGERVIYYYCSSDAASLDGVFFPGRSLGIIDGTAPHTAEPCVPGAAEQIIDLGRFWDEKRLGAARSEIEFLMNEKKKCFDKAYACLAALGAGEDAIRLPLLSAVRTEKMKKAASRLLSDFPDDGARVRKIGLRASVGMSGTTVFDTYESEAEHVIRVRDYGGLGYLFLRELTASGRSVRVSFHPIFPDRPDALYFFAARTAVVLSSSDGDGIDMRRFIDAGAFRAIRPEVRATRRMGKTWQEMALRAFARAADFHFALERVYADAMDFPAKETFTAEFCRRVLTE